VRAPHERRVGRFWLGVFHGVHSHPRLDRLALPFCVDRVVRLVDDRVARGAVRLRTDEEASLRRRRLKPRRGVHNVTRRERVALAGVERHDRVACVHRCACGELEPVVAVEVSDPLEDGETGPHGALRIVSVCGRRAEDGHHRIADVLLDNPAVLLDPPLCVSVVELLLLPDVLWVCAVGAGGEADEVDEEHRDELALLARCGRRLEPAAAAVAEARLRRVLGATVRAAHDVGPLVHRHHVGSVPFRGAIAKARLCSRPCRRSERS
jgi:hypothetical protein